MSDIPTLFDRYGWAYETVDVNLWCSTFFTENEEEFDLYVLEFEDWVHFAVTPFLPPVPAAQAARLHTAMLRLNQQLCAVRFALDADGDVSLIADAPASQLTEALFATIVEAIVFYTERLSGELRRLANEPAYASPLIQD